MLPELEPASHHLRWVLQRCAEVIEPLERERLHWRPSADANSAAMIGAHVAGATAAYTLGLGAGQEVSRDRLLEFAPGDVDATAIVRRLLDLESAIAPAFDGLTTPFLDAEFLPEQALWGTGEPQAITHRNAIIEALRHAAIHLGELRLTRDLAVRAAVPRRPGPVQ